MRERKKKSEHSLLMTYADLAIVLSSRDAFLILGPAQALTRDIQDVRFVQRKTLEVVLARRSDAEIDVAS
jgi:hypothetical protein